MNSPYGQIAWWGFSPSIDLIDYMKKHEVGEEHKELNVLNGIAYHKKRKTLFVTGKNWNKLFEVKIYSRK